MHIFDSSSDEEGDFQILKTPQICEGRQLIALKTQTIKYVRGDEGITHSTDETQIFKTAREIERAHLLALAQLGQEESQPQSAAEEAEDLPWKARPPPFRYFNYQISKYCERCKSFGHFMRFCSNNAEYSFCCFCLSRKHYTFDCQVTQVGQSESWSYSIGESELAAAVCLHCLKPGHINCKA